jgi:energy-coupling factor transporter ATP-binding protein EcfA2
MTDRVLVMDRVSYRYAEAETEALAGVDLAVGAGEWVGVVGPTNAGKSTLCLAAIGLAPHFFGGRLRGTVTVFGRSSRDVPVAERSADVGLLFQNPFTQVSGARERVDEEVAFGPECHGLPIADVDERVGEALRLVGLEHLAARHPTDLSGGQLQRMALAGLLAMRPRLLLLDEPTSQLDPAGAEAILDVLRTLHAAGTTIVMVEHRLEAICELCPRVVAMASGSVLADGPPAEVFNRPDVANAVGLPAYARIARRAGLPPPWPVDLEGAAAAFRAARA